jgi:hypothetical protein
VCSRMRAMRVAGDRRLGFVAKRVQFVRRETFGFEQFN